MRTGEAALLAAIINANGEAVKAPNRQTAKVVKQKLGSASARIETVRGKGYRWVA
jgi:DNA-binding response OmpR family regulator